MRRKMRFEMDSNYDSKLRRGVEVAHDRFLDAPCPVSTCPDRC